MISNANGSGAVTMPSVEIRFTSPTSRTTLARKIQRSVDKEVLNPRFATNHRQ
jgi:hypothetical protein